MSKFDLNMPLSVELCEFIGAFIGDGFTNKYGRHHLVEFTGDARQDKEYLLNHIGKNANALFALHYCPYFSKAHNGMRIRFHNKQLFQFLTERFGMPKGKKCYTVKIPNEVLVARSELLSATIRGIFDTDGGLYIDNRPIYRKPYLRMELHMINPPLLNQVQTHLEKVGVKSKILSGGTRLQIMGKENVSDYLKKIGFSNRRHLDRLSKYDQEMIKLNKSDVA